MDIGYHCLIIIYMHIMCIILLIDYNLL